MGADLARWRNLFLTLNLIPGNCVARRGCDASGDAYCYIQTGYHWRFCISISQQSFVRMGTVRFA